MKRIFVTTVMLWLVSCVQAFAQERGPWALPGIDTIPLEAVLLTPEQMQEVFIVSDALDHQTLEDFNLTVEVLKQHNDGVRKAACMGYVIHCGDRNNPLTTPFTFLAKYDPVPKDGEALLAWLQQAIRESGGEIVTESSGYRSHLINAVVEWGAWHDVKN